MLRSFALIALFTVGIAGCSESSSGSSTSAQGGSAGSGGASATSGASGTAGATAGGGGASAAGGGGASGAGNAGSAGVGGASGGSAGSSGSAGAAGSLGGADAGCVVSTTTGVPLSGLGDALAELMCREIYTCCTPTYRNYYYSNYGTDVASCRALVSPGTATTGGTIQDSVDLCRAGYDGDLLAQCLLTLTSGSCPANPRCQGFLSGRVPLAGACTKSYECVSGLYCSNGEASTPGTCIAQIQLGSGCTADRQCADGYCKISVGVGNCAVTPDACFANVYR